MLCATFFLFRSYKRQQSHVVCALWENFWCADVLWINLL